MHGSDRGLVGDERLGVCMLRYGGRPRKTRCSDRELNMITAEYGVVTCSVGPPCLSCPVLVGCPTVYFIHLQVTPVYDTASKNKRSS